MSVPEIVNEPAVTIKQAADSADVKMIVRLLINQREIILAEVRHLVVVVLISIISTVQGI